MKEIKKIELLIEETGITPEHEGRVLLRVQPRNPREDGEWYVKPLSELDGSERTWVENILAMATSLTNIQKDSGNGEKKDGNR